MSWVSALAVAAGRDPGTARPDPGGLSPITDVAIRLTGAAHSKREGLPRRPILKRPAPALAKDCRRLTKSRRGMAVFCSANMPAKQLFQTRRLVLGAFELSEMMEKRPAPSVPCVESF